jgi:cell division protein FtsW
MTAGSSAGPLRPPAAPAPPVFRGPLAGQRPRPIGGTGFDVWLVAAAAALVGLSIVMVFNVSYFYAEEHFGDAYHFFRKHVFSIALGTVLAAVASRIPSQAYRRATYPLLLGVLVALVLVAVPGIGLERGGARRWLGVGPLSLQPSELAKIALVLYLAHSLVKKRERVASFKIGVLPHCLVVGTIAGLALLEPDFGTAVLAGGVLVCMLFVGGVPVRYLVAPLVAAIPGLAFLVIREPYRVKRVLAFLNPDLDPLGINFQLKQSFIAFGSGGLWGVGLGESRQKLHYLPEAHTDFIYSVVGEELGLAGALLVLSLFAVLAARGFRIAVRHPDPFASLLAFGLTLSLVLQGVVNVGVVLGCLPTKGLALPFVSYGGSAMMASLAQVGMLLALARESSH